MELDPSSKAEGGEAFCVFGACGTVGWLFTSRLPRPPRKASQANDDIKTRQKLLTGKPAFCREVFL